MGTAGIIGVATDVVIGVSIGGVNAGIFVWKGREVGVSIRVGKGGGTSVA